MTGPLLDLEYIILIHGQLSVSVRKLSLGTKDAMKLSHDINSLHNDQ